MKQKSPDGGIAKLILHGSLSGRYRGSSLNLNVQEFIYLLVGGVKPNANGVRFDDWIVAAYCTLKIAQEDMQLAKRQLRRIIDRARVHTSGPIQGAYAEYKHLRTIDTSPHFYIYNNRTTYVVQRMELR